MSITKVKDGYARKESSRNKGQTSAIGIKFNYVTDTKTDRQRVPIGETFYEKATDEVWKRVSKNKYVNIWDNSIIEAGATYTGGRNRPTTNSYVDSDRSFMNLNPIVINEDMVIDSITASTYGPHTWTAEIHNNGNLISGATLSIDNSDYGIITGLNISISKGDKLMFYVNGEKINRPKIIITCK